jgi:T5SS/PEP-CTERM-associated repeat protein
LKNPGKAMNHHRMGTVWRLSATLLALALPTTPPAARAEDNTLTVIDGVTVTTNGPVTIGSTGTNNGLIITNGGILTDTQAEIGSVSGANWNNATVTGSGSVWLNQSNLTIGVSGQFNTLQVLAGGVVTSLSATIGLNANATGNVVTISGPGSVWRAGTNLVVGASSRSNELRITDGGRVTNGGAVIGLNNGATLNVVRVSGAGSQWGVGGLLTVGSGGRSNSLFIMDGGEVLSTSGGIGTASTATNNRVEVSGAGSRWLLTSNLTVGSSGRANQLVILTGGRVSNQRGLIGSASTSSNNLVLVDGPGSLWENRAELVIGGSGSRNLLIVTNGGRVTSTLGQLGGLLEEPVPTTRGDNNLVIVTGAGSLWSNATAIRVGSTNYNSTANEDTSRTNRIILADNGTLITSNLLISAVSFQASGMLGNLNNGVEVNGGHLFVTNAAGTGTATIRNGRLDVESGTAVIDRLNTGVGSTRVTVADTLFMGHTSLLLDGQMRVGRLNGGWTNTAGAAHLGGLVLGAESGSYGALRFSGASTLLTVTNAAGTALVEVGRQGIGQFVVSNATAVTDSVLVGADTGGRGTVFVSGSTGLLRVGGVLAVGSDALTDGRGGVRVDRDGILEANLITTGEDSTGALTNSGGVYQFTTNAPSIPAGSVFLSNGIISFRGITDAPVSILNTPGVSNVIRTGGTYFQLNSASNSHENLIQLDPAPGANYQGVILRGTNSELRADAINIKAGAFLLASNTQAIVSGTLTNAGVISLINSGVDYQGPVMLRAGASVAGTNATHRFLSGLYIQSNNFLIQAGSTVEANLISVMSGSLSNQGGTYQVVDGVPVIPNGGVVLDNGTFSYRNNPAAPLTRLGDVTNIAFLGANLFQLNNSTNALLDTYVFQAANSPTGWAGLKLEGGTSLWQSTNLTFGPGGRLYASNTSTIFDITSGLLVFSNAQVKVTAGASIGFRPEASGQTVLITGNQATWNADSLFTVGDLGSNNRLLVSDGASLTNTSNLEIGTGTNSSANEVWVSGNGSSMTLEELQLGDGGTKNLFVVSNGANVTMDFFYLGWGNAGASNMLIVSGTNSTLTHTASGWFFVGGSHNRIVVKNGGRIVHQDDFFGARIGTSGSYSNSLQVTGSGSSWESVGDLRIGFGSSGNHLLVTDGATVQSRSGVLDYFFSGHGNNTAEVVGLGSVWSNSQQLVVGDAGSNNRLTLQAGGTAITPSLEIGRRLGGANNLLTVNGGFLIVTNPTSNALLTVGLTGSGTLLINRGSIITDGLNATNGLNSVLIINGGTLDTRTTLVTNGSPIRIGDATNAARLHLRGGTHTFNTGLTLNEHAALTGSGTVVASVTNRGTLAPGDSAGALTLQSNLSLAASARMSFEIGGLLAGTQHDFVAVSNLVEFAGTLSLALLNGFTPAPGDAFTLMTYGARSGAFANAADGARVNTANNLGSFHVSYSGNALTVSAYQSTDADGDGIEDAWAVTYFGASPLANGTGPTERFGDLDGDGQSNHAEFVAGTNPTDALDVFGVTELLPRADGAVRVRFRHLPGKTQRLFVSTDLVNWTEVPNPWLSFPAAGTAEWLDDGVQVGVLPADPAVSRRYYRVTVE